MSVTADGGDKASILLVDDQPARLLSYGAILGNLGLDLVEARSGREALQRLMEREFAAILLDVNMPDMDGFETAAMIHRHPRFERTPIIFVTAVHVTDLDRLRGYELGAFDYVYVPVVPEILRNKVQVLAELYGQRRKLERLNRSLEEANVELASTNTSLQAERSRDLQALNRTLEKANLGLAEANAALEAENIERRRAESSLREADQRKNEFLATLSHELRNPLAAIANAVQFMQLAMPADARVGPSMNVLGRQVSHLIRLIDDLLDVSRITSGKIMLRTERVDLVDVVERALETARPLADERGQRLEVALPASPLLLVGDPVRLIQVIGNLLVNAIKYTAEGGRVELGVGWTKGNGGADDQAVVRVTDTGIGIAPEMLPKVFDLFSQADYSPVRQEGGLGIGLALVRELVGLHGGTVEASSAGPGQGAEFVVRLPLAMSPSLATPPVAPDTGAVRQHPVAPRRVLLVDDNHDSAESLAALLRILGHEVSEAYDGRGAIAAARRDRPDLILLDIGMPDMSGYEVARQLRADPGLNATTLIALTGYGSEDDRRKSQAAGFDGHLVKPIDFDDLERLLASLSGVASVGATRSEAA